MKKYMSALLAVIILFSAAIPCALAERSDMTKYAKYVFKESYPVYSGPGYNYYRANEGKATYGANGSACVYGIEGEWLLIGYGLSNGDFRVGYIDVTALNHVKSKSGSFGTMSYEAAVVTVKSDCSFTDDPYKNHKTLCRISAGAQVTFLEEMDEWAYIEIGASYLGKRARGFVKMDCLLNEEAGDEWISGENGPILNYKVMIAQDTFDVLQGPGEEYAKSDFTCVNAGDTIRMYGIYEGQYALIAAEIAQDEWRFGYTSLDVASAPSRLPAIVFKNEAMPLLQSAVLYQDPFGVSGEMCALEKDAQVTLLGWLNARKEWAYVEVNTEETGLVRGFIRYEALTTRK